MRLRKKRSEPDLSLAGAITAALTPGNGRSNVVGSHDELLQRLREDGVEFKVSDFFAALGELIKTGAVAHRDGTGFWLNDGPITLWEPDITRVADIEGSSGGSGGWL